MKMKEVIELLKCRMEDQPQIDTDPAKAPEYFGNTPYKTYPRFPQKRLQTVDMSGDLQDLIRRRETCREFSKQPIAFGQLSNILYFSCGQTRQDGRAIESGGALYPIEAYVISNNVYDLARGIYHYNVLDNTLEQLWVEPGAEAILLNAVQHESMEFFADAGAVIVLTAIPCRQSVKYGMMALPFALKEAGAIGHAIALNATLHGLGKCESGGFNGDYLASVLDIDTTEEVVVSLHAIGNIVDGNERSND